MNAAAAASGEARGAYSMASCETAEELRTCAQGAKVALCPAVGARMLARAGQERERVLGRRRGLAHAYWCEPLPKVLSA